MPAVYEQAQTAVALATAQGFALCAAYGTSIREWALAMQAQDEEAMAQIRRGITAFRATGAALLVPYLCTVGRTRLGLGRACGDPGCHLVVVTNGVRPTVSLDVISLVASSYGYYRGHIEQHAAQ